MSSGHALLTKQSRVAAKIETVAGTAVSLTAAEATFIASNFGISYDSAFTKRNKPGTMSQLKGKPQNRGARVTGSLEMLPSTSAQWLLFLKACGFVANTNVYTPVSGSASADTMTVGHYVDGRLKQAAGVSFSWTMRLDGGMIPMLDVAGEGCYVAPTATALITPTYETTNPATVRGITFTIGGTTYTAPGITISGGNSLYLRPDITSATGYKSCEITDRNITVAVSLEALGLGTKDWYDAYYSETESALSVVIGSSNITIAAPKMQLETPPQDGDRNGILTDELVFQCNVDSGADDSEFSLTMA